MEKVYARDTVARFVDISTAQDFVSSHHDQGASAVGGDPRAVGLFLNEDLLGVAIFCNPRTSLKQREYTTELLRLAFHKEYRITGGASKLIKFFIDKVNPADIFTYQTTAGENTDVYSHAGFSLKNKEKIKTILVKNGLTQANAKNNRSDWFSMYEVVNFGPDALLKTKLGEIFKPDGTRMSNVDIFIELCGYHKEEIAGDKVYEWLNPNVSYYCYKITAPTRDEKYYIGRKRINSPTPTKAQCEADGYLGSGGLKFKNWVKLVDEDKLEKEILGVYSSYKDALRAESRLIGDKHISDPNCLNSIAGGRFSPVLRNRPKVEKLHCSIHGDVKHQGGICSSCTVEKALNYRDCSIHGFTKHQGSVCSKCNSGKSVSIQKCEIHGLSKHQGTSCMKCNAANQLSEKNCSIHGRVLHKGNSCTLCTVAKALNQRKCSIHGVTTHQGSVCNLCNAQKSVSMKKCSKHGVTKHQGSTCNKCNAQRSVSEQECSKHGLTKFQGTGCVKCRNEALIAVKSCSVHGDWKHRGNTCYACMSDRRRAKKLANEKRRSKS